MQIVVNGEQRMVEDGLSITGLLNQLDVKTERVAVEVNMEIVDRALFLGKRLCEGDRVEVISFVGGG